MGIAHTVRNEASEIPPNNTMPGRAFAFIEL